MKKLFFLILFLWLLTPGHTQMRFINIDSVKSILKETKADSSKVQLYASLSFTYSFLQVDSGIRYAQLAISLAKQIQDKNGEAAGKLSYGWALWASVNYDKAIESALSALNLFRELKNAEREMEVYGHLAVLYRDAGDLRQALRYGILSQHLYDSLVQVHQTKGFPPFVTLGTIYLFLNQVDSASFYLLKQSAYDQENHLESSGYTLDVFGNIEFIKKNYQKAIDYYHSAIATAIRNRNNFDISFTYSFLAQLFKETERFDSSIYYAKEILNNPGYSTFQRPVLDALTILSQDYRQIKKNDSAFKYLVLKVALGDSLFNIDKTRAIQNIAFNETLRQQEIDAGRIRLQNQLKLYAVFALAAVFLLVGIILYRSNKIKQNDNLLLQQQKLEVERTLKKLESTQEQLIQSEKMASLGVLTSGIAHEIQNPLNFVNNFSEVNKELIGEMKLEIDKGNLSEIKAIAVDLENNEDKIMLHGRRADAIVKSMLQHTRESTGKKESTDINEFTGEYLRLAYHRLRSKDNSFHATMKTDFDKTIGGINIIQQDISRVLLNIFNNAFYAVAEKAKTSGPGFKPTIEVGTRHLLPPGLPDSSKATLPDTSKAGLPDSKEAGGSRGALVEIHIKDNGTGIPEKLMDKIFQPFFTTKPTGQGTGLGLSLSYDIVKAHGGQIKVNSREWEFTEFIIQLPLSPAG